MHNIGKYMYMYAGRLSWERGRLLLESGSRCSISWFGATENMWAY